MSKSKCGVQVISSTGESFTTKRGARRLVDNRMAIPVSERCIRMVESHYRYDAAPNDSRPQSPRLRVVDRADYDFDRSIQIAKGEYRNEVLGLPNFVGIQPARKNIGRKVA